MRTAIAWITSLALTACGGTVSEEPNPSPTDTSSTDATGESPDGGAESDASLFKEVPLGDCTGGFDASDEPDHPCNWMTEDEQCFDTRDAACNCACPQEHDSICSSGFYRGEGQATLVSCY